ncbi:hypothetical protein WDV13_06025 [Weissella cibaria]|uniref:DinB/UmuC family translesion DNA polymerase n=1 Tax=Weissella cibaria TaxID=137591 RepID=UPI00211F468B|nr:hypothetical protein [Weissella cibaria]
MRAKNKIAGSVSRFVGYSHVSSQEKHRHSFNVQTKIRPTNNSYKISQALTRLYEAHVDSGIIRHIGFRLLVELSWVR